MNQLRRVNPNRGAQSRIDPQRPLRRRCVARRALDT